MIENTKFEIVTPLDVLISKEVKMAVLPGVEGYLGVMSKHTPLMTLLKRGIISLYDENDNLLEKNVIDGGVAEVKNEEIVILSERAELVNSSSKQIINEKILNSEKQLKNDDKNISSSAEEEIEFLNFVLDNIN